MAERTVLAGKDKVTSTTLLSDQRGAVAFEMLIVWSFLMMCLLLPLADVAIAGFQYISAWQSLRAFGQYLQYNPPDATNMSSVLAKADPRFPISNFQVVSNNAAAPVQYYSYSTTVTLSPMVLTRCVEIRNPCSFTLSYSERFQ